MLKQNRDNDGKSYSFQDRDADTTTVVYRYSALAPTEGRDEYEKVMRSAGQYYNDLVAVEKKRRQERLDVAANLDPEIAAKLAEIDQLCSCLKTTDDADKDVLREGLDAAWTEVRSRARKLDDHELIKAVSERAGAERNTLQQAYQVDHGLRSGMYGLKGVVRRAAEQASKARRVRFRRGSWDVLYEQIPGGMTADELFASAGPDVRADSLSDNAWSCRSRRRRAYTNVYMRLDNSRTRTEGKRRWVKVPILMHRPLPEGCRIVEVRLCRERVGPNTRWAVCFTVNVPVRSRPMSSCRVVGLDLGWRTVDGGVRVAMLTDGDTKEEWVRPNREHRRRHRRRQDRPGEVVDAIEKSRELKATRDKNLDRVKETIREWIQSHPVPQWLTDEASRVMTWRSPARVVRLYRMLSVDRVQGDDHLYTTLRAWVKQDRHLWEWQVNQEQRARRRRREFYRVQAARLARRCGVLGIERLNMTAFTRASKTRPAIGRGLRDHRAKEAPGELVAALKHAFGGRVIEVEAAYTTMRCAACGHVNKKTSDVYVTCAGCDRTYNRDENGCENVWMATMDKIKDLPAFGHVAASA